MKLVKKEVGHGVTTERYTAKNGKKVVVLVSTAGGNAAVECHYTVLDMDGNRSGCIYSRDAAMQIAESKVL